MISGLEFLGAQPVSDPLVYHNFTVRPIAQKLCHVRRVNVGGGISNYLK